MWDLGPVGLLAVGLAALAVAMAGLWVVQRRTADAGVVDVGWAAGLALLAGWVALGADGDPARRALVATLGGVWGLRLALHLLLDRVLRGEEDGRYRALRAEWGARAQPRFFLFFQAQALVATVFAVPFLLAARSPRPGLDALDAIGVGVWALAVGGEWVADRQLARFRRDPGNRGRTCRVGLWRWSRHPNYFFEWIHWFAYVPLAVGAPWWPLTLLGPALMLLFLFRLTGIPYTERRALESRGEDYRRYQRETSAFVPLPPRGGGAR